MYIIINQCHHYLTLLKCSKLNFLVPYINQSIQLSHLNMVSWNIVQQSLIYPRYLFLRQIYWILINRYTDFSKAFNKISYNIFFNKLTAIGFDDALVNSFRSYLPNTFYKVERNNLKSNLYKLLVYFT